MAGDEAFDRTMTEKMMARACKIDWDHKAPLSLKEQIFLQLRSSLPRPSAPGILRGSQDGGGDDGPSFC